MKIIKTNTFERVLKIRENNEECILLTSDVDLILRVNTSTINFKTFIKKIYLVDDKINIKKFLKDIGKKSSTEFIIYDKKISNLDKIISTKNIPKDRKEFKEIQNNKYTLINNKYIDKYLLDYTNESPILETVDVVITNKITKEDEYVMNTESFLELNTNRILTLDQIDMEAVYVNKKVVDLFLEFEKEDMFTFSNDREKILQYFIYTYQAGLTIARMPAPIFNYSKEGVR